MLNVNLHLADCTVVLPTHSENSFDSVVTDPPYEISLLKTKWDSTGIAYHVELWKEILRVLKPGGYLLAFGNTRTYHRMACAIEDAGFEIKDSLHWMYGTGFPPGRTAKSIEISKALKKQGKTEAEIVKETEKWQGYGTALKPSHEPIVLARKPLSEDTVAKNVLRWGTGAMNIDGCRIGLKQGGVVPEYANHADGRWPTNVVFSHLLYPVLKFIGHCPSDTEDNIRRYFNGYIDVSALRRAGRANVISNQIGTQILFSELQESGSQNPSNSNESGNAVPVLQNHVPLSSSLGTKREEEVLQPRMFTRTQEDFDRGGKLSAGNTSYYGDQAPNLDNETSTGCAPWCGSSFMEGWCQNSQWIQGHQLCLLDSGAIGNSSADEDATCLHFGTPISDGNVIRKGVNASRERASYQWCQIGQSDRKSNDSDMAGTFTSTPSSAERTDCSKDNDRKFVRRNTSFEVFATDVPNVWLDFFEPAESLTCGSICLAGCPIAELDRQSGTSKSIGGFGPLTSGSFSQKYHPGSRPAKVREATGYGDEGGASRYFWECLPVSFQYCSKPGKAEKTANGQVENAHLTVKPLALMKYLVRLVTPAGGTVLDPFMGSGTTGVAAVEEGMGFVGVEMDAEFFATAEGRIRLSAS